MAPHKMCAEIPKHEQQLRTPVMEGSKPSFAQIQADNRNQDHLKFANIGILKCFEKWNETFITRLRNNWGWIVTFSTLVLFIVTYGFIGCYGLIFVSLQQEFHRGATETGWVGSLAIAVAHFAGPLTNYLVLKLKSARRVVLIGVVFCFCGLIFSSLAPNIYFLFVTIGVAFGLGLNMISQSALVLIVQYFPDKNGTRSVSVACTGLTIGMLILSPIVNYALETIGWRATLRWFGGVTLVIGSLCTIPMLPVAHKTKNMQRHLTKSNFSRLKEDRHVDFSKQTSDMENTSKTEPCELQEEDKLVIKTQKSILRRGKLWLLCVCMFFTAVSQTFYNINYVSHLNEQGISANQGAVMMTLYAAGQIASEILLSIIAEKLPFHNIYVIAISSLLGGIATIPIAFSSSTFLLKAISTVLGFLRAPRTVLIIPLTVEMFGVHQVQQTTAVVMCVHGLGFIVGAFVMGLTFDKTDSYRLSITICISLLILASLLYLILPIWSIYMKWRRPKTKMCQVEDEVIEDCHVVPMSNFVARVREIVPILVGSQESLAFDSDDHEYQHLSTTNCIDHSNDENDREGTNETPVVNDLIIHLTDTTDIVIHSSRVWSPDEHEENMNALNGYTDRDEILDYHQVTSTGTDAIDTVNMTSCETGQRAKIDPQMDSYICKNKINDQRDNDRICTQFEENAICNGFLLDENVEFQYDDDDCVDTTIHLTENPLREHFCNNNNVIAPFEQAEVKI